MEARLAASMARLNQSIEQMRQIEERSKSTDATLARIARIQASWVPAEQVVQEGMERRRDSFSPQMGATAQALARISGVKAVTPTSSTVVHHDMKSETTTTMDDAHKVFDVWSTQKEVTMSNIIHVSVSHTIYPVTEVVLRQVFEMYGYSVTTMAVLQGRGWVEASVQLQSGHEAVHARNALHGRNIYDGCCNLSIKCMPTPNLPATPSATVVPNAISTSSTRVEAPMSPKTVVNTPAVALSKPSKGTGSRDIREVFAEMLLSPTLGCNRDVVQPSVVPTPAAVDVHPTHLVDMVVATPPVADVVVDALPSQEKVQGSPAPKAFDTMYEVIGSQPKPHIINWVSINLRSVRWTAKGKYHHSSVPSSPPRPPDQSYSEKKAWCRNAFSPGHNEQPNVGIIPTWNHGGFSTCKLGTVSAHSILDKLPPWRRSGFSPGYFEQPHFQRMPSWRHGGFNYSVHIFVFIIESRLLSLRFWIKVALGELLLIVNSPRFFVSSRVEFFRLSPVDVFQNLYLGTNIHIYEGYLYMPVIEFTADKQHNFGGNSQCVVQLRGHFMLGCPCLIFIWLERASKYMVPVMEVFASWYSVEVRATYRSTHMVQVDFELEVKVFMQLYWPWDLRCVVNVGAKDSKHTRRDILPEIDHELNTTLFVMIPKLVLSLQGYKGLALLIVREPHGVYWILVISVVSSAEVSVAHVQWDPGGFLSTMSGEHEPVSHPQCRSVGGQMLRPEHAIAWGQAMFCRGGSVTPDVQPVLHLRDGPLTWARPNRTSLGEGRIKQYRR